MAKIKAWWLAHEKETRIQGIDKCWWTARGTRDQTPRDRERDTASDTKRIGGNCMNDEELAELKGMLAELARKYEELDLLQGKVVSRGRKSWARQLIKNSLTNTSRRTSDLMRRSDVLPIFRRRSTSWRWELLDQFSTVDKKIAVLRRDWKNNFSLLSFSQLKISFFK